MPEQRLLRPLPSSHVSHGHQRQPPIGPPERAEADLGGELGAVGPSGDNLGAGVDVVRRNGWVGGDKIGGRLSGESTGRAAEDLLGSAVRQGDDAVISHDEEGLGGSMEQFLEALLGLFDLGDLLDGPQHREPPSGRIGLERRLLKVPGVGRG